jgi:hypothetical protein
MTGTRGSRKKSLCWTFFSKLVEHTLARPRTDTLEGAGRGRYRRTFENAKSKCYLHCTLTHTHTHSHTLTHTHTVAKGDRASAKAFFEVSALEPTLGILLVFSKARHGMKGPALRGWPNTLLYLGKKPLAKLNVKNDRNARIPQKNLLLDLF